MLNFIFFCGILLVAGFPAAFVFALVVMGLATPLVALRNASRIALVPFTALLFLAQAYFWGAWAAFSVGLTRRFIAKPEVTWDWLYWIAGFGLCTSLVGWFASKERAAAQAAEEPPPSAGGAAMYWAICAVLFLIFAIWPVAMDLPYGWLLRLLNLAA